MFDLIAADRQLTMFQFADFSLFASIDDKFINRATVFARHDNLVALGIIIIGVHPIALSND